MNRSLIAGTLAAALMLAPGRAAADGPYPGSDASISAAVQLALWREGSLVQADIRAEAADGAVTLRGFAGTMEDIATGGCAGNPVFRTMFDVRLTEEYQAENSEWTERSGDGEIVQRARPERPVK